MNKFKNKRMTKTLILILVIVGLFLIIISVNNKMNKNFTVREKTLTYKNISPVFDNYKILQLSDLHSKEFGKNNSELITAVKKINPDLILVTGDMFTINEISINMNEEELIPYKLLSQLAPYYKIIYTSGNHEEGKDIIYNGDDYTSRDRTKDNAYNRYRSKLESLGVIFVENTYTKVYLDDNNLNSDFINVYGVYYESMEKDEYYQSISIDKTKFNIMLCHDPKYFDIFADMGFDLVLSGHVHGGVIRLPFLGGLLSPDRKLFPKYDKGIYKINDSYMNVSTGLGYSTITRVFNPPEINLLTLKTK